MATQTKTQEPVIVQFDRKNKNRLLVEDRETGVVYAYCFVGDAASVEEIADSLSVRRMPKAAIKFRQMARDAWKIRVSA